jgi:hypothetical protein
MFSANDIANPQNPDLNPKIVKGLFVLAAGVFATVLIPVVPDMFVMNA